MRNFTPLSKLLPQAFQKFGLARVARAALVCSRYRKAALKLFSKDALLNAWPQYFRNKTLIIGVSHPAWGVQIMESKEKLLAQINDRISEAAGDRKFKVMDIRTKVAKQPKDTADAPGHLLA